VLGSWIVSSFTPPG